MYIFNQEINSDKSHILFWCLNLRIIFLFKNEKGYVPFFNNQIIIF